MARVATARKMATYIYHMLKEKKTWTCPVSVDTSTCGGGHLRRLPLFGEHSFILRRALVVKG